jgi:serine/threonine protein kinase
MAYVVLRAPQKAPTAAPSAKQNAKSDKVDVKGVESSAKDFKSMYSLGKVLGKGNFSVVRQAVNKTTGETVAVKCIDPKSLSKEDAEALVIEIDVLKNVSDCLSVVWFVNVWV